jgi:hypothetical protein
LQFGLLLVLYFTRSDDPAERVVFLAQIPWQLTIERLPWHLNILIVEIDAEVDTKLIII